jgi:hypothetical protein
MEDFLREARTKAEAERTEPRNHYPNEEREAFQRRLSRVVFKPTYAARKGNFSGGER